MAPTINSLPNRALRIEQEIDRLKFKVENDFITTA